MKNAIVYDAEDIKAILAERHGVKPKDVIRNQYSYTVILEGDENTETSEEQDFKVIYEAMEETE